MTGEVCPCGVPGALPGILCAEHRQLMERSLRRYAFTPEQLEEIRQDVWLEVLEEAEAGRPPTEPFRFWLRGLTRRVVRRYLHQLVTGRSRFVVMDQEPIERGPGIEADLRRKRLKREYQQGLSVARESYVRGGLSDGFDRAAFFDAVAVSMHAMVRDLGREDYALLRRTFPPGGGSTSPAATTVPDPARAPGPSDDSGYLRVRVNHLRRHVRPHLRRYLQSFLSPPGAAERVEP